MSRDLASRQAGSALADDRPHRSVDDESKPERRTFRKFPKASEWNFTTSPPYSYWLYYMYANMGTLVCYLAFDGPAAAGGFAKLDPALF